MVKTAFQSGGMQWVFAGIIAAMIFIISHSTSYAQLDFSHISGASEASDAATICGSDTAGTNVITAKIVHCIRATLIEMAEAFNDEIADIAEPIIGAYITLVVVFFGIKVLEGEGQPQRDGFILLLKIGIVYAFFRGLGGLIPYLYLMMEEGIEIVTSTLTGFSGASGESCNIAAYESSLDVPNVAIWAHIDCMLGFFFGFGEGAAGDEIVMAASIFGLMATALASGTFGVMLGFSILLTLLSFVFLVIRAVYGLLAAYIYITIMVIISPLVIPLLLGGQQVSGYFSKWLNATGSAMFVPIFLFAYLALVVGILDKVIFDESGSASEIGSLAGIMKNKNYEQIWGAPTSAADCSNLNNPEHSAEVGKEGDTSPDGAQLRNDINTLASGSSNLCRLLTFPSLDPPEELLGGESEKQVLYDLFMQLIKIVIVIYVLAQGLDVVVNVANNMMPGGQYFFQQALIQPSAPENVIRGTLNGAQARMGEVAQNPGSANILQQWRNAMTAGAGGALQGLGSSLRREFTR